jgi:hypothetical protein
MKAPRTARFNGFCWEHQQKTNWKDPPFYSWENPRTFDWAMASIAFCRFTRPGAPNISKYQMVCHDLTENQLIGGEMASTT